MNVDKKNHWIHVYSAGDITLKCLDRDRGLKAINTFGFIPIEVKLGTKVTQRMLSPLKSFIKDTNVKFGILVNNGTRIEILSNRIIQIPAIYL